MEPELKIGRGPGGVRVKAIFERHRRNSKLSSSHEVEHPRVVRTERTKAPGFLSNDLVYAEVGERWRS